ncbi:MAG: DUF3119 family protein [Cyanosarcina radialis HA8281-LM2]|jgi:hypothetical protein|nr:DUF3119 family protein [Cyanosarcina radialis HA8281-LM2]
MDSTTFNTDLVRDIELKPSYTLPLVLLFGGIGLVPFLLWLGLAIAIFGIFLIVQTATIRLKFTATALEIYRSQNLIRSFPYQQWQDWRILWQPVPIWFYFKEVNSIHSLPIIFDRKMLLTCLEERCPVRK